MLSPIPWNVVTAPHRLLWCTMSCGPTSQRGGGQTRDRKKIAGARYTPRLTKSMSPLMSSCVAKSLMTGVQRSITPRTAIDKLVETVQDEHKEKEITFVVETTIREPGNGALRVGPISSMTSHHHRRWCICSLTVESLTAGQTNPATNASPKRSTQIPKTFGWKVLGKDEEAQSENLREATTLIFHMQKPTPSSHWPVH